jgi:hypothetical protein
MEMGETTMLFERSRLDRTMKARKCGNLQKKKEKILDCAAVWPAQLLEFT